VEAAEVVPGRAAAPRRRFPVWAAVAAALLGIHAAAWIAFTAIAVRDPGFAVEPDHYRKGMGWDAEAAQLRANRTLGWSASVETGPLEGIPGDRRIACRIADREGLPVAGASVELEAFHHARGGDRFRTALAGEGGGTYAGRLPMARPGVWECRIAVRRGPDRFTHIAIHEIPEGGGR